MQIDTREKLYRLLEKVPGFEIEQVRSEIQKELEGNPPRIALIGETGVGKTTTINALFNQGLEISHTVPCTTKPEEFEVQAEEYIGSEGLIKIIDMPGLGEDLETDEKHKKAYFDVLPTCDVAVWILKADVRTMTQIQVYLKDVVGKAMGGYDRIVIGLNQVDVIQPGKWNEKANISSLEQEVSISERLEDISKKIRHVCDIQKEQIIPYSALKRYRLENLFNAMMEACPQKRAWTLLNRKAVADFAELIDPEYRKKLGQTGNAIHEGGE